MTTVKQVGSIVQGALISNMFLSVFLGVAMKRIWTLINTLQILVMLPNLSVSYPSNFLICLKTLFDISNVKLIPAEFSQKMLFRIKVMSSKPSDSSTTD
jgi:hypothetical protein